MQIFISELVGTMLLILLGNGVVAGVVLRKTKSENSGWLVINLGWAFAVMIGAYAAKASGGHLNPVVTLVTLFDGKISFATSLIYLSGQIVGAFIGALLVYAIYIDHYKETTDQGAILGTFATGPAISNFTSNILSEIVGTFVLVFSIFALSSQPFLGPFMPLLVGLVVLAIGLSLGGTTGYAINPVRDLVPRLAHYLLPIQNKGDSNFKYAIVPLIGPIIGATIAYIVFNFLGFA